MNGKISVGRITKKKKTLSLEIKLDILRRFDNGEKAVDIAKALNLPATTVRTIQARDRDKIKEAAKSVTSLDAKTMTRTRSSFMIKMESLLSIWIQNQIAQKIPLSKMVIQAKAKSLFEDIKSESMCNDSVSGSATDKEEHFEASNGWFERYKIRANLHSITLKGEAASADTVAADRFPMELKAIIQEGGYDSKQVFNVDETGLFWKRLPKRTFISRTEKSAPGFKGSKDRLTLLLGGNANGDFKFKPFLVYQSENPRALKGCSKNRLPVHWRANKKSWMTALLFKDWVSTCAIPEIKSYCNRENLDFKALVLVDNAPGHPVYIDGISENVKFVFLPPNTTSLIQPMDQGVISNFKSYYLRRSFKMLLSETDGPDKPTMQQFWKSFNILKAINIISESWEEVKPSCMNGVWRKIWPECVHKKKDDSSSLEVDDDEANTICHEIANLAKEANFEGMDEVDINELLASHNQEMSNEELMQLDLEIANEEDSSLDISERQNLTSQQISKAMNLIDEAMEIFSKNDPDSERSSKVSRAVANDINCYKELYLNIKKQAVQQTLDKFFEKKETSMAASSSAESE